MTTNSARGFTLLELGVAILVLDVAGWLLVEPLASVLRSGKQGLAQDAVQAAKDKILGAAIENQALPALLVAPKDPWSAPLQYLGFGVANICAGGVGLGHASLLKLDQGGGVVADVAFVVWSNGANHAQDIAYDSGTRTFSVAAAKDDVYGFVTFPQLYKLVCQPTGERRGAARSLLALRPARAR